MQYQRLQQQLNQLDGRSYKAYKEIQGRYEFPDFTLSIDYVQGDPFASPSKLSVRVPQSVAGFPGELYHSPSRNIALGDYLTREFAQAARQVSTRRGTGKSGQIAIAKVTQEVLERTCASIHSDWVEIRFTVGLPAQGRRILGHLAAEMLCDDIPKIVEKALFYRNLKAAQIRTQVETIEDADWLRDRLKEQNLIAFIANGAILPRRSGVDDRPLSATEAIPFVSPESLQVEFDCPNRGQITGMGIPTGITLIVGGGYHGKSTLLRAIELGVYNHIPGDGREFVVTDPGAMKIRAEDGRSVVGVDISPFINHLPQGRSTQQFSTTNASGSTSQAANIMEALEAGTTVLLVDEDTAATNFMIRDRRMQALIAKEKEPITPFIDKIKSLTTLGISTILVMGGSGDYFDVADRAVAMDNFVAYDVTDRAKAVAAEYATGRQSEGGQEFGAIANRIPIPNSLDPSSGKRDVRLKVRDVDEVRFGMEDIDLTAVEQIVDPGQLRAIAAAMVYSKDHYMDGRRSLREILDRVMADIDEQGLDVLTRFPEGDLVRFRPLELAAALNRLRTLQVR
ncbi:ABC-ATPase domain-containing protein [Laspinema olomoucense]|uniref:ABC-ATPase domain-containing protein n=1 Tax=Laspinema olomoucense TaxID=3231600 RepID=UPI0021BA6A15|nr:ABC-ATPase domain-containing protein [Laspinema sp. D3a]MCT7987877.1 ABC-ATPase domain-containing protein [Laspinema sp. D3a]